MYYSINRMRLFQSKNFHIWKTLQRKLNGISFNLKGSRWQFSPILIYISNRITIKILMDCFIVTDKKNIKLNRNAKHLQ